MGINDKIDIDNETEQVKNLRVLNSQKSSNDVDNIERKGFCTNCSIYWLNDIIACFYSYFLNLM